MFSVPTNKDWPVRNRVALLQDKAEILNFAPSLCTLATVKAFHGPKTKSPTGWHPREFRRMRQYEDCPPGSGRDAPMGYGPGSLSKPA
jgi:hypothetical protein